MLRKSVATTVRATNNLLIVFTYKVVREPKLAKIPASNVLSELEKRNLICRIQAKKRGGNERNPVCRIRAGKRCVNEPAAGR